MKFTKYVFRGIGQVFLQENAGSGALFLLAVAFGSLYSATALLIGSLVGTATASFVAFQQNRNGAEFPSAKSSSPLYISHNAVRSGLHGFNGALTAVALQLFLPINAISAVVIVLACIATVPVMSWLSYMLKRFGLPALTAPFLIVSFVCLIVLRQLNHSSASLAQSILQPVSLADILPLFSNEVMLNYLSFSPWITAVFTGVSQVFLQKSVIAGVVIIAGLVVSSRFAALAAMVGSIVGIVCGVLLGAPFETIATGVMGFNGALVAVALVDVFAIRRDLQLLLMIAGSAVAAILFETLTGSLQPLGLPTLTVPFVLTVWIFTLAGNAILNISLGNSKQPR